jgi:hypothetical protein
VGWVRRWRRPLRARDEVEGWWGRGGVHVCDNVVEEAVGGDEELE